MVRPLEKNTRFGYLFEVSFSYREHVYISKPVFRAFPLTRNVINTLLLPEACIGT